MDLKTATEVLEANIKGNHHSFLGKLHERDTFCKKELKKLADAIATLACQQKDFETGGKITEVYSQILLHVIYHFNPNDDFTAKGVNRDIYEDLDRLHSAVDAYFRI